MADPPTAEDTAADRRRQPMTHSSRLTIACPCLPRASPHGHGPFGLGCEELQRAHAGLCHASLHQAMCHKGCAPRCAPVTSQRATTAPVHICLSPGGRLPAHRRLLFNPAAPIGVRDLAIQSSSTMVYLYPPLCTQCLVSRNLVCSFVLCEFNTTGQYTRLRIGWLALRGRQVQ